MDKFIDRQEAGRVLAKHLKDYANLKNVIVLALPRGGVPIGYEIAQALSLPLDIFVVRKLGIPGHEELAMGAIASGDSLIFNHTLTKELNIDEGSIQAVVEAEQQELLRRERLYRGNRVFPTLTGQTIILVDDGIATGASMQVAIASLRKHHPAAIVVAVPVAASETCEKMEKIADRIVCPLRPINFYAVGVWYGHFPQVSDEEVLHLLVGAADIP